MKLTPFIYQMHHFRSQTPRRNNRIFLMLCVMAQFLVVCACLAGCSHTSKDSAGYIPLTNSWTDEERAILFHRRGERLYRAAISEIWYPFGWDSPYLFVDMGVAHPVMLTSGKTFDYTMETGERIQTCMECEVYYHDGNQYILLGTLESLNTGYPITYDETGFYTAGDYGVEKYIVDESGSVPCLRMDTGIYQSEAASSDSDAASDMTAGEYALLYNDYLAAQIIDYGDAYPFLYKYADEEIELLQLLEKEAGCKITEYRCIDMNQDGHIDIAGVYKKDNLWHVLYLCGDDHVCLRLEPFRYDFCELRHFPAYDDETYLETHLLVNVYDDAEADRHFSIYALEDHVLQPVIANQPGCVYMDDTSAINQTLYLSVEDCGDGYSAITYLHYEDGAYKEFGILELSESKFMQYDNAEEVLTNIRTELGTDDIHFTFYAQQFSNIRIQCEATSENGDVRFCHFTLNHDNNLLRLPSMFRLRFQSISETQPSDNTPLYNMHEGRLKNHFTDLEVTYPAIDD
ncbi:MAG: hypothetical protein K2L82_07660 [Lachnospiraceae bacterium]|nr:hypothetical protein [Lachnospiraceae bacterium]